MLFSTLTTKLNVSYFCLKVLILLTNKYATDCASAFLRKVFFPIHWFMRTEYIFNKIHIKNNPPIDPKKCYFTTASHQIGINETRCPSNRKIDLKTFVELIRKPFSNFVPL